MENFYQKPWFAILLLILFAPIGIFLIWKYSHFTQKARIVLTIIFGILFLYCAANSKDNSQITSNTNQVNANQVSIVPTDTPIPTLIPTNTITPIPTIKTVTLYADDGRTVENVPEDQISVYGPGWYTHPVFTPSPIPKPENSLLITLQNTFKGIADVNIIGTDNNIITLTPYNIELALLGIQRGEQKYIKLWNTLVASTVSTSKTTPGYYISIQNPLNQDNSLLMVYNGKIIYNWIDNL